MTHAQFPARAGTAVALRLGGSVLIIGAALGSAAPSAIEVVSTWSTVAAIDGGQPVTWGW
jgi:hypothetical protein